MYGVLTAVTLESFWMGASADSTCERNAGAVASWSLLLKTRRKEVPVVWPVLSLSISLLAREYSRALLPELPLVNVPPPSTP